MPIRGLEGYLADRRLTTTTPLTALRDTRLGIDVHTYLRRLLSAPSTREPLVAALGGHPLALMAHIESDLRLLDKWHIKPVFVFPGLAVARRFRPGAGEERAGAGGRAQAWAAYEAGRVEDAVEGFADKPAVWPPDLLRLVHKLFRQRHVEFIVAPYVSWPQLVYLANHPKSYIHAVYGPTEQLLYPQTDKLITSLDLRAGTFTWVAKRPLLADIKLGDDQFVDVALLAGIDCCGTFPPASQDFEFKQVVETVRHFRTGWNALQSFRPHPLLESTNYAEAYQRASTLLRFSLILAAEEGRVLPLPLALPPPPPAPALSAADIPSDLAEVFSPRLPDEVYFHLCRGLVGPWALNALAQGGVQEVPPLDGGESNEYRTFVKEGLTEGVNAPRNVAVALFAQSLNAFWKSRPVYAYYYFHPHAQQIAHNAPATVELVKRAVEGWNVHAPVIEEELRRQNSSTIDFALCLGATTSDKLAARTRTPRSPDVPPLQKKDEIVANTVWRVLELRGFLTQQHTHTPYARAMHNALAVSRLNDKFQEPLYIFIELLRAKVLHADLFGGKAYSGGPSFGTEDEKRSMLLIIRTLSVVPLVFKSEQWSGPLSRELLVFNSFVKGMARSVRTLAEAAAASMLLRGDAKRLREDYLDIALSLPFQNDVNSGFGIFFKVYLDALVTFAEGTVTEADKDKESVLEAKRDAQETLSDHFTSVKDTHADLMRGFRFWDAALVAVRTLSADKAIEPKLAAAFEKAEKWLSPMRPA